jgi:hypothetical protein
VAAAMEESGPSWAARVRRGLLPPDATSKSSADQSQDAVAMRPHEDIHAAPETALEWPHNPINYHHIPCK